MEISQIINFISKPASFITNQLTNLMSNFGFSVSARWSGLLVLFLSLILIFVGIKIAKPLIKISLIIIAILLFIGLIMPVW